MRISLRFAFAEFQNENFFHFKFGKNSPENFIQNKNRFSIAGFQYSPFMLILFCNERESILTFHSHMLPLLSNKDGGRNLCNVIEKRKQNWLSRVKPKKKGKENKEERSKKNLIKVSFFFIHIIK